MTPERRTAALAGALYLLTFVSSIPAVALLAPVLVGGDYLTGPDADARVVTGALLDAVNAAACIGTAVVLLPVLRRTSEVRAVGFVTSRVVEAAIILVGVLGVLAVVTLRGVAAAGGADPALGAVADGLVAVRDQTFLLGPGLVSAVNALLLASVVLQARLVPRAIPLLGLVGAPLQILSVLATAYGLNEQTSPLSMVAVLPIFLWELSFGLWLLLRGFRSGSADVPLDRSVAQAR